MEGIARPASSVALGQARGSHARPHLRGNNLALALGWTLKSHPQLLAGGLVALYNPRRLVQLMGRGGLQPHPRQPQYTLPYMGPAPHTQGLAHS